MALGEQIKQRREEKNLSQEELAERIGVSRQAVSKWEGGRAVPTGANRRALGEALSLEMPERAQAGMPRRTKALAAAGWGAAALLLAALLCVLLWGRGMPEEGAEEAEGLLSVRFYDAAQEEVLPEALWYNAARMESILIQWTGSTPAAVKMFYTPAGSETMEQTELLATKTPADGERALLLSARELKREDLSGHVYFELDFGGGQVVVTDSLYNVFYNPEA